MPDFDVSGLDASAVFKTRRNKMSGDGMPLISRVLVGVSMIHAAHRELSDTSAWMFI